MASEKLRMLKLFTPPRPRILPKNPPKRFYFKRLKYPNLIDCAFIFIDQIQGNESFKNTG